MMESNNPTPQVPAGPVEEEDPLLELARIVSGDDLEPKPAPELPAQNDPVQPEAAAPNGAQDQPSGALDKELEAALMDDLSSDAEVEPAPTMLPPSVMEGTSTPIEPALAEAPAGEVAVAAAPATAPANEVKLDEFESSLEQQLLDEIDAETAGTEPYMLGQSEAELSAPVAAHPEAATALADEPSPPVVEDMMAVPTIEEAMPSPVVEAPAGSPEPLQAEVHGTPVPVNEEPMGSEGLVAQPPVAEPDPVAASMETPVEIPMDAPVAGHESVGVLEEAQAAGIEEESVTEEDLGKIFAAEFEQINAEHSGVGNASDLASEFEQIQAQTATSSGEMAFLGQEASSERSLPSSEDAGLEEELSAGFSAMLDANEALEDGGDLEAEFASAFDDELAQNEILPATQIGESGWDEQASQDAELEFAAAVPGLGAAVGEPLPEPEHLTDPSLLDEPANAVGGDETADNSGARSGIKMAAIALGVALFAGLGAVSYGYMTGGSEPSGPIIVKADEEPVKVKPADPGGRKVANQDKASYKEVAGDSEATEQAALVSTKEEARVIVPQKQQIDLSQKVGERLEPVSEEVVATAKPSMTPRKVRTFTVKPDGTIIAPDPVEETPSADASETDAGAQQLALSPVEPPQPTRSLEVETPQAEPSQQATAPIQGEPAVETTEETAAVEPIKPEDDPSRIDGAISTGALAVPSPSPLPKPVAAEEPKPQPSAQQSQQQPVQIANLNNQQSSQTTESTAWVVQISSQKSEEAALSSLKNLQSRFPALLNGRQANIKEAKISGKGTFYRVRVNTQSREDAGNFCARFKSAGGSCFVTR